MVFASKKYQNSPKNKKFTLKIQKSPLNYFTLKTTFFIFKFLREITRERILYFFPKKNKRHLERV